MALVENAVVVAEEAMPVLGAQVAVVRVVAVAGKEASASLRRTQYCQH